MEVVEQRVGRWSFRQRTFDVASEHDLGAVLRWLDEPDDKPRTIGKLALCGSLTLRDRATLESALADASATYGALEQWDRHEYLVTTPDDEDLDAMGAAGFVADALAELRAAAAEPDGHAAGDALALLYRTVVRA